MVAGDALVVDDDRECRDALSQVLVAHGYTVRQAENGKVALDLITERVPGFLVLDLEMPVMSGWEVLESLHRVGALQSITILVLSAGASPPPGVAFIRKPCRVEELLSVLSATSDPGGTDGSSSARHPQCQPATGELGKRSW